MKEPSDTNQGVLPDTPSLQGEPPQRPRFSRRKLALAFTIAAIADGLSLFLTLAPPVQWAADLGTAIVLFVVLGWQWVLLPGLIMEAIPGVYVFPFWVLVVGAVALTGGSRPKLKGKKPLTVRSGREDPQVRG